MNNVKTASEIIKQQRAAAAAHLELIRVWHLTWGEEGFDKPDPLILHPLTQWRSPLYTIHDSALCYHIFVTVCIFCSLPLPINWSFSQSFQKNAPRYIRFFNTLLFFQCPMAWTYKWQKRIYVFLVVTKTMWTLQYYRAHRWHWWHISYQLRPGASFRLCQEIVKCPTPSEQLRYYRQMLALAGDSVTQYWNSEEGIM